MAPGADRSGALSGALGACVTLCPLAPAPAARAQLGLQSLLFEAGVRTGAGPDRVPAPAGDDDRLWEVMYHVGATALLGARPQGGLMLSARWDGFDPNRLPGFPWALSARVGFFEASKYYIDPGMREHEDLDRPTVDAEGNPCTPGDVDPTTGVRIDCDYEQITTHHWWDPGGWASQVWMYGLGFQHGDGMRQGSDAPW